MFGDAGTGHEAKHAQYHDGVGGVAAVGRQ
jgi:hypothetical protein